MRWIVAVLAGSLLAGIAGHAHARVERFAIVVGNNLGAASETPLRYAESDAARVFEVLTQLGDFDPINSVLLRGRDATTVRSTMLSINGRIRDAISQPDTQAVLAVYYSGHADGQALHLGGTEFPLAELRDLARGSAANFRLVVLDACRSGSLTRVKGGERVPAFVLTATEHAPPPGDGLAFLTASSATEDAQESDELQGAFFTHAFISGLLGAADADSDGAVVLDEAYRYAYDATLRSTSRTVAGTQHPTFQYDLRGRGELVLTRPRAHAAEGWPSRLTRLSNAIFRSRRHSGRPVDTEAVCLGTPRTRAESHRIVAKDFLHRVVQTGFAPTLLKSEASDK